MNISLVHLVKYVLLGCPVLRIFVKQIIIKSDFIKKKQHIIWKSSKANNRRALGNIPLRVVIRGKIISSIILWLREKILLKHKYNVIVILTITWFRIQLFK